ncbi:hypothetical protein CPB86DRAFT_632295 [Serendipita vermifera]|nr:hypothetical protein CPB86DRAFT_632295 [Serendipita vermifera]
MNFRTDLNLVTAFVCVIQHPNGTYEQGPSVAYGEMPVWNVSQQSGEVTANSSYNTSGRGPNDPICLEHPSGGQLYGGCRYIPEKTGLYNFEPWVIYTFGQGEYDYQQNGRVCLNPPFTYEAIKIATLRGTVSPNPNNPSITSVNSSTITMGWSPSYVTSISSVNLQPSPTGETFRIASGSKTIVGHSVTLVSALGFLALIFTLL